MNTTKEEYKILTEKASPSTKSATNITAAFLCGGGICVIGELIKKMYLYFGATEEKTLALTAITLVLLSSILTGLGVYCKIAKRCGAGTLVPITGFANAVASSALESKAEGFIFGVGAKIFTIAGPVILYGISAGMVYGFFYWISIIF